MARARCAALQRLAACPAPGAAVAPCPASGTGTGSNAERMASRKDMSTSGMSPPYVVGVIGGSAAHVGGDAVTVSDGSMCSRYDTVCVCAATSNPCDAQAASGVIRRQATTARRFGLRGTYRGGVGTIRGIDDRGSPTRGGRANGTWPEFPHLRGMRMTPLDKILRRRMHQNRHQHPVDDRCDPAMIAVLRSQSPGARLAALDAMWRSAVTLVRAGVKAQHPDWSETMLCAETARRMANRHSSEAHA